eukprot:4599422-Heterocapsa_arctica.AAC.1
MIIEEEDAESTIRGIIPPNEREREEQQHGRPERTAAVRQVGARTNLKHNKQQANDILDANDPTSP